MVIFFCGSSQYCKWQPELCYAVAKAKTLYNYLSKNKSHNNRKIIKTTETFACERIVGRCKVVQPHSREERILTWHTYCARRNNEGNSLENEAKSQNHTDPETRKFCTFSPFLSSQSSPKYSFSVIFSCLVTQSIRSRPLALFCEKKIRETIKTIIKVMIKSKANANLVQRTWRATLSF